jgi:hypothetical protein
VGAGVVDASFYRHIPDDVDAETIEWRAPGAQPRRPIGLARRTPTW